MVKWGKNLKLGQNRDVCGYKNKPVARVTALYCCKTDTWIFLKNVGNKALPIILISVHIKIWNAICFTFIFVYNYIL